MHVHTHPHEPLIINKIVELTVGREESLIYLDLRGLGFSAVPLKRWYLRLLWVLQKSITGKKRSHLDPVWASQPFVKPMCIFAVLVWHRCEKCECSCQQPGCSRGLVSGEHCIVHGTYSTWQIVMQVNADRFTLYTHPVSSFLSRVRARCAGSPYGREEAEILHDDALSGFGACFCYES